MLITLCGIVILVRFGQLLNPLYIDVTLLGIVTLVRLEQSLNAPLIDFTPFGMTNSFLFPTQKGFLFYPY